MVLSLSGFRIGHYEDETALTGCTVLLFDEFALAAADVRGSAPATANFSTLDPLVRSARIDAILLTGGSSFGLSAVAGVQKFLEKSGKGFDVGVTRVPNVPCAAIFDLAVGDTATRPTADTADMACRLAVETCDRDGSVGVGMGASVGKLFGVKQAMRGGFGFSSATSIGGATLWAFAAVNAFGDVWDHGRTRILAGARTAPDSDRPADAGKLMREGVRRVGFGGAVKVIEPSAGAQEQERGSASSCDKNLGTREDATTDNTTLVVLVTSAALDLISAKKLSQSCMTGITDVVYPACTIFDGDLAMAVSIGKIQEDLTHLCLLGQWLVSDAIVSAVKAARSAPGLPAYVETAPNPD